MPWNRDPVWIISASVFSPTKWCHRKLSVKELLFSKDTPQEALENLSEYLHRKFLTSAVNIPGKCCTALLEALTFEGESGKKRKMIISQSTGLALGPTNVIQEWESSLESRVEGKRAQQCSQGAAKADDAPVPCHLWDGQ